MRSQRLSWQRCSAAAITNDSGLSAAWDALNASRRDLPFMTAAAVGCALENFGTGAEVLLVARHGARIVAMAILARRSALQWQTFQPSQLPLGAWVSKPDLSLADAAGDLLRDSLRFCLALSLTQMDPWLCARQDDAAWCSSMDYVPTAWIDVSGSFDDYWAARGKNLRQNMRKQRSRLSSDGTEVRMMTWTDPADMAAAVQRYGILESAGWKSGRGTAISHDNAQGHFYRKLLEIGARQNGAAVYEGLFGERTVAMNLCVHRAGTLVVLKTTYDESVSNCSPAFLLHQDMLESVFTSGSIRRVEYYGRVMDWHTRWTHQQRTLYHLTAYRWPIVRRLAARRARSHLNEQDQACPVS